MTRLPTAPLGPDASSQSLGSWAQAELERLIAAGELQPGERLNEVALARRLGVSRGPVREAARALEKAGLVTVIVNRGAFVRSISIDEAMEIYEMNAVLFGFAAGQVAESITAAQAMELRDLVDAMDRAAAATDRDMFFGLNTRFHARILAFARNRQAEAVYLGCTKKLLLLRRRSFEPGPNMIEANAEHRRLLEAMLAGESELARRRGEEHARAGRARFLASIDYRDGGHACAAARTAAEEPRGAESRRPQTKVLRSKGGNA